MYLSMWLDLRMNFIVQVYPRRRFAWQAWNPGFEQGNPRFVQIPSLRGTWVLQTRFMDGSVMEILVRGNFGPADNNYR